ncbi:MAG: Fur family transcriptional regulator [Bacteroidales bacterium]|nr:Fur family transcriptional regulator [Bacteroidales bacterium]
MEKEKVKEVVKQEFIRYLEAHKHRKTPERFAVLEQIYSMSGHFDIETLHAAMQDKFRVSLATLYNTLDLLVASKLVIRHKFGVYAQYEKAFNNENHYHLICEVCGEMQEVKEELLFSIIKNRKLKKFTPSYFALYIYGVCSKCKTAQKRKKIK